MMKSGAMFLFLKQAFILNIHQQQEMMQDLPSYVRFQIKIGLVNKNKTISKVIPEVEEGNEP